MTNNEEDTEVMVCHEDRLLSDNSLGRNKAIGRATQASEDWYIIA